MPSKRAKHKKRCSLPLAKNARVRAGILRLELLDGRLFFFPMAGFPVISAYPVSAQKNVRVIFGGTGISWPDLGYELGVGGLVRQATTV